ncbi:2-dehydropantoate 2-reductase N-terminal domain-containing protein [Geomicrobium sp. JCM 19037]|uniref:2-dehydropantoate 2-reductase N-terminal domain-containing protein n=1 Tax=Geomicrobium sp. JCM 19037 TaxID=1460634 RepID=UPI0035A2AAD7
MEKGGQYDENSSRRRGAVGGYFGARLHEAGQQVTFLVRSKRRVQLQKNGLIVKSRNGDLNIFDLILSQQQMSELLMWFL